MPTNLTIFEELVASEAAIRGLSIARNHGFRETDKPHAHISTLNMDAAPDKEVIARQLFDNYLRIYDYQFQDSSQHKKMDDEGKSYNARDLLPRQQEVIRSIFKNFVEKYYDAEGKLTLTHDEAPAALAHLYEEFKKPTVALRHSTMALGSLLVELSQGDKWKTATPKGIDFTRGLHTTDITQRMHEAINGETPQQSSSTFIDPPGREHVEVIAGLSFPKKYINGHLHLVSESGYLIDLTDENRHAIEEHIKAGKPIHELTLNAPDDAKHLAQFMERKYTLPGDKPIKDAVNGVAARQSLAKNLKKMMLAQNIDGAVQPAASKGGRPMRLFCLDEDLSTGLLRKPLNGEKQSELDIFKKAVDAYSAAHDNCYSNSINLLPEDMNPSFHDLSAVGREKERARIKQSIVGKLEEVAAATSSPAKEIILRAAPRFAETLEKAYERSDEAFIGKGGVRKKPVDAPRVYITQGGTGSGKGSLKKLARKECGDSLVVASLDDMRGDSDKLWLYPALEIHHDDYISVTDFGNAVRDLTAKRAREQNYNLLIDGSGIPYEGRNDVVAKEFKDRGYHVSVLGAQAPLSIYQPGDEADGLYHDVVLLRGGIRLQDELRFVPLKTTISKHVGHPIAAHNAARDENVDRFMIMDTSPPFGKAYTLSYVVEIPAKDFTPQFAKLEDEALRTALKEKGLIPEWVTMPSDELLAKDKPHSDMKVIGVKEENGHATYRVEVILNLPQYVNMVQKGLYNAAAEGPEALFDHKISCDIDGLFKSNAPGYEGRLRLQPALGLGKTDWPKYQPPLTDQVQWNVGTATRRKAMADQSLAWTR